MNIKISKEELTERGLIPKEIIGATDKSGTIEFLIEFTDATEGQKLISNQDAKDICPHLVIQFYEKRLVWRSEVNKHLNEDNYESGDTTDDEINL